jgi:hypothetical protein
LNSNPNVASERRSPAERPAPIEAGATYISANPGWHVVWVGEAPAYILYRHEVVAWRIGTHQRVVPLTVDDVPSDYAIEYGGRLYEPFADRGTPSRVYTGVDEYHRTRIAAIDRATAERARKQRETEPAHP